VLCAPQKRRGEVGVDGKYRRADAAPLATVFLNLSGVRLKPQVSRAATGTWQRGGCRISGGWHDDRSVGSGKSRIVAGATCDDVSRSGGCGLGMGVRIWDKYGAGSLAFGVAGGAARLCGTPCKGRGRDAGDSICHWRTAFRDHRDEGFFSWTLRGSRCRLSLPRKDVTFAGAKDDGAGMLFRGDALTPILKSRSGCFSCSTGKRMHLLALRAGMRTLNS
jgi:hypothetical protein